MRNLKLFGFLLATGLAMGLAPAAQAAPVPYSPALCESASTDFVTKAVTGVGVAHRSARRTTRRTVRRRTY